MATRIHPKNVQEKSPKNVHEMLPKVSTRCHLFCQRDVTYYVHEMSATQIWCKIWYKNERKLLFNTYWNKMFIWHLIAEGWGRNPNMMGHGIHSTQSQKKCCLPNVAIFFLSQHPFVLFIATNKNNKKESFCFKLTLLKPTMNHSDLIWLLFLILVILEWTFRYFF